MQDISVIEPIKIKLKKYKTLFRRALPLEKHEKAILGLINQNNGNYGFIELGTILGFAVEDNADLHIRKDVAEIQLFESYLENLKFNHLIEYDNQSIQLTFWGEKAITDDLKYSFYSGNIQIPEFFDIELSNEASDFTFKEIGVEVRLRNEQNLDNAWDLTKLKAPDHNLVNQFHLNRLNKNDEIIFDSIEPLSNSDVIDSINLEFIESNSSINVLYDSKYNEYLSKEINNSSNKLKADYLKLKIYCKRLVESEEGFFIEDLTDFVSIIDWTDILDRSNIIWGNNSIELLEKFQVNWNLISSKAPIAIIQDVIDDYLDKFDWLELTNRLNLDFILANIDQYRWDVDVLVDRVTLAEFKDHVSKIIKLPGIDLYKFYRQVDKDFIKQNFNQLPNITIYISTNDSSELLEYLLEYSDAPWNHTFVTQKLNLAEIEENFSDLKQNLNFEILIKRFISDNYDCNADTFEEVISVASLSDNKILNRFSECNLSLTKLQILDNHELIYWGNDVAPGFELNPYQNWSTDTVRTFENKWGYNEAIQYLSGNISDSEIIEKLNFEWDFDAISKNSRLVNQENFFEENKNRLDVNSAIKLFDKNTLKSNLRSLFLLDQESKISELSVVISKLFSLDDVIETNANGEDVLLSISSEIDWKQIWSKTPKSFVKKHIEEIFNLLDSIPSFSSLLTEITNCFEVEDVFESPDFAWDWNNVTERAIDEDLVDDETLFTYPEYWDWKVLVEKYFDPEDLQIEGRLSEIAALISQAPDEVSEKSWKFITDIYPSPSIWSAINTTYNIDLFKWDWSSISSSNKISLDLYTLNRYKERINWSLLSSNLFLNGFFRNDHEMYGTRKDSVSYTHLTLPTTSRV